MTQYISRAIAIVGRSSLSCVKRGFHVSPRAMVISVGDKLPSVDLYEDAPSNKVNSAELVSGKKIIIFGVPGAFTPGCSKTHLPGYVTKADELKSKGIDEIACVSVNDPFVMSAWGKDQGAAGKVRMLADTNAEFTKALDVAMDLAVLGGTRSKRYSLVVEDGIVKEVNIEPDNTGLSCSLADRIKV
ncbi:GSCOCG00003341001-RA-CDS [Cotesia congregata]|uniref:Peroxiredoxin-5 n=1 Tax=Cotesia congregata TaxID=51543 RepID=A0A8J2HTL7_COTCN|nr:GSCOCG00003341001-RA-CDS [Cotesia congregata]CAG5108446.1 Similar to PRDX5: Peroxiredoxin-5 [Cotesia congregata]